MSGKKIALYGAVTIIIIYGQFFMTHGLVTGTPPALPQQTIDGKPLLTTDGKQPGLIYFWANWCGVCKSMQDSISIILKEYPGVTVAMQSGNKQAMLEFQKQAGIDWPIVPDREGQLGEKFKIQGVPTLFFLDKNGQIRFTSVGYTTESAIRFKLWLTGWLF